jgi:NitT/TauT family transport system substrate-binding protein
MKKLLFSCLLLVLLLASVCPAGAQDKPLRMAYLQNDIHHLALWVALEKGFFPEQGVDLEIAGAFKAGPEVMSAFAAGALDMAYVGSAPATVAMANQATDVAVVAQVNTEGSALVVRKDSGLQEIQDLQGKTVAVPGHSTVQDFLLRKALKAHGLEMQEVNTIVLKPPEMISALRSRQIDAFIAWEPYPAKAYTMGVGRNLATSRDIWPEHPCCVLVVSRNYLQSQPRKVKAVLKAHIQGTRFIEEHPQEAVRIGAKYTGMDKQTVQQALRTVHYTPQLSVQGELEYVRFLNELGYIQVDDPELFVDGLIHSKLLDKILAE